MIEGGREGELVQGVRNWYGIGGIGAYHWHVRLVENVSTTLILDIQCLSDLQSFFGGTIEPVPSEKRQRALTPGSWRDTSLSYEKTGRTQYE